jgi:hypothetical protein
MAVFAVWETYWAYVFVSAPNPDEKMQTVFAIGMAVVLPLLLAGPVGLIYELRKGRKAIL